jgi:hypothetical protein
LATEIGNSIVIHWRLDSIVAQQLRQLGQIVDAPELDPAGKQDGLERFFYGLLRVEAYYRKDAPPALGSRCERP